MPMFHPRIERILSMGTLESICDRLIICAVGVVLSVPWQAPASPLSMFQTGNVGRPGGARSRFTSRQLACLDTFVHISDRSSRAGLHCPGSAESEGEALPPQQPHCQPQLTSHPSSGIATAQLLISFPPR